jgi:cysteine desulfurase
MVRKRYYTTFARLMQTERRYFDWAATAIPDRDLLDKTASAMKTAWANPSSRHAEGRAARDALENARKRCAAVLGVPPDTLYFTASGTEANALVIHAFLRRFLTDSGNRLVVYGAGEHASVRENCRLLGRFGLKAVSCGMDKDGFVTTDTLTKALAGERPRLACVMAVNNETGAMNDIATLAGFLKAGGVPCHLHVDCVQALGKVPLDLTKWGVDSAAFSAHKLRGPRGIGLLFLKKPLEPLYLGGGQEHGIRSGTENTAGALSFATCMEKYATPAAVAKNSAIAEERMSRLIAGIVALGGKIVPSGRCTSFVSYSPWILQAAFSGIPGETLVRMLDDAGFACSTGSACSSRDKARPVLDAMAVDKDTAFEAVRLSQGWTTTQEDVDALIAWLSSQLPAFQ